MIHFPVSWKCIEQFYFTCAFFPNENISILGVSVAERFWIHVRGRTAIWTHHGPTDHLIRGVRVSETRSAAKSRELKRNGRGAAQIVWWTPYEPRVSTMSFFLIQMHRLHLNPWINHCTHPSIPGRSEVSEDFSVLCWEMDAWMVASLIQ
jgi:hypothetical protein